MISIFPTKRETLVVSHSWDDLITRISNELNSSLRPGLPHNLTGWVKDDHFQLTIRLRRQHYFMPLINGTIEPTSKGSIIFLTYTLFPATRLLLLFWSIVLPVTGLFISMQYKNFNILAGEMAALIIMHLIAWVNFNLHLKSTRELLLSILESPPLVR